MSKYYLSALARVDLLEIWQYIANDSIEAADHLDDSFLAAFKQISSMPGIGHFREDLTPRPFRFFNVKGYLIVYNAESSPIEVVRILSGVRDLPRLLE